MKKYPIGQLVRCVKNISGHIMKTGGMYRIIAYNNVNYGNLYKVNIDSHANNCRHDEIISIGFKQYIELL